MPFTFAHPAIVLPLLSKRWVYFSATALIAGSIAPDFESFIGLGADKEHSHTWLGVFWFDLPVTLLLALVFHVLVKKPLIDNLPPQLSARFEPIRSMDWVEYANEHYIVVILSALLGVFSHMLWDACTHLNIHYPDAITSRIMWKGHRVYIILQYASSLLGLLVIAFYIYKMPAIRFVRRKVERRKFWLFQLVVSVGIFVFVCTSIAKEEWLADWVYLINVAISSSMYSLIIMSIVTRFVAPKLAR